MDANAIGTKQRDETVESRYLDLPACSKRVPGHYVGHCTQAAFRANYAGSTGTPRVGHLVRSAPAPS